MITHSGDIFYTSSYITYNFSGGSGFNATNGPYLYNNSLTVYYNETKLNETIVVITDARDDVGAGGSIFNTTDPSINYTGTKIGLNISRYFCADSDHYPYQYNAVTGLWDCAADSEGSDTDTWNTTTEMRTAINNSGYYNISVNYSNVLNHPSMVDTYNTTAQMLAATNISAYFQHQIGWANLLNVPTWNNGSGTSNITTANILAWFGNYSAQVNDSSGDCATGSVCTGGIKQGNTTAEFINAIAAYAPNGTAGAGITVTTNSFAQTDYSSIANLTPTASTVVVGATFSGFGHMIGYTTALINNLSIADYATYAPNGTAGAGITVTANSFAQTDYSSVSNLTSTAGQAVTGLAYDGFGDVLTHITGTVNNITLADAVAGVNTSTYYYPGMRVNCSNIYFGSTLGSAGICDGTDDGGSGGGIQNYTAANLTQLTISTLTNTINMSVGVYPNGTLYRMGINEFQNYTNNTYYYNFSAYSTDANMPRQCFQEFYGVSSNECFSVAAIASGTSTQNDSYPNHPGVFRTRSSTTNNSGYVAATSTAGYMLRGGEVFESMVNFENISNTTHKIGFFDTQTQAVDVDAAAFVMFSSGILEASLNKSLCGMTSNNSNRNYTATCITPIENTWYRLRVTIVNNATTGGVEARFQAWNASTSGGPCTQLILDNTVNTRLPTGTGRSTGFGVISLKNMATQLYLSNYDYMMFNNEKNISR